MNRINVAVFLYFFLLIPAFCQESDTVHRIQNTDTLYSQQQSDTIFRFSEEGFLLADTLQSEPREVKSPTRALMLALVLPGLGQAYNEKYWKMPIVWGALGGTGFAIVYNTRAYEQATLDYILEETDLNQRKLEYRKRNMELSYIVGILVYGLQILDAYVDAYLYSWDVNDQLSLGISPSLQPLMTTTGLYGVSGGLTCSFKIKGK